jgi:hypothetical protein
MQTESWRLDMSRRAQFTLIFFALLILLLIIFLNFPVDVVNTPAWLAAFQLQLNALVYALIPYGVVGLLGAIVAIAELSSTFQTYPREALRTRWASVLVVINIVSAILALIITRITMPEMNPVLQVLAVGVGFQALIRTRFILAKPINGRGEGEISLNLGWLYDQFQNLCRTQIDLELMNNRRTAVTRLLEYYPSLAELYDIAWYTIIARATLSDDEEAARLAELEKLIDPKAPEQFARTSIALMVLENGGQAYVDLLLDQAMDMEGDMADALPVPQAMTTEKLVWELIESYSVDELVALTSRLTDDQRVCDWVKEAAAPDPGTSEANRKSAIAHFLVQQLSAEVLQNALQEEEAPASSPDAASGPPVPPTSPISPVADAVATEEE